MIDRSEDERALILGRALIELEAEIKRLRGNPCPTQRFGLRPTDVAGAVISEVNEVLAESPCSQRARTEAAGVLAASLHLVLVHGGPPETALKEEGTRLRQRNDLVAMGHTWAEAKLVQRFEVPAIMTWSAARHAVDVDQAEAAAAWSGTKGLEMAVFFGARHKERRITDRLVTVVHVATSRRQIQDYADEAQAKGYVAALRFADGRHEILAPREGDDEVLPP